MKKVIEKKVSKIQSLLNKKQILFCEKIGLSVRPSSKLGIILAYIKKNGIKIGQKLNFSVIGSDSIGRKEREFFGEFFKIGFSPLSYKVSFDGKGKKTGNNFKEYTKAQVVKA